MPTVGTNTAPGSMPAGGVAGQVLMKGAGNTAAWQSFSPLLPSPIYASGSWHDNRFLILGSLANTVALTANTTNYMAVWAYQQVTISGLGINCTAVPATATHYMGVSLAASSGLPGTLLQTAQLSIAATGARVFTLPSAVTVGPGWFYISLGAANALTITALQSFMTGGPVRDAEAQVGGAVFPPMYYQSAAATTVPVSDPSVLAVTSSGNAPLTWFQIA